MSEIFFSCLVICVICSDLILIRMIRAAEKKESEDIRTLIDFWEHTADILMTVDEETNRTIMEITKALTGKGAKT